MSTRWNRSRIMQLLGLLGILVLAVVFREPLLAWFRPEPANEEAKGGAGGHAGHGTASGGPAAEPPASAASPAVEVELSAPTIEYVRAAFGAYEATRALLADDKTEGLAARAQEMEKALQVAAETVEQRIAGTSHASPEAHATAEALAQVASELREAEKITEQLAAADALEPARVRFAALSESFVALAAADPRLQEGFHVFSCPMVEGFNKWLQRSPELDNPYMGPRMAACGAESEWHVPGPGTAALNPEAPDPAHAHAEGEISHYTCPMHPSIREQSPGQCPICGMDLTPVTRAEVQSGIITVDPGRRQTIGVKTAEVKVAPLVLDFRALGTVTYDETKLVDVTLKLDGYIHDLKVDATGQPVKKGAVLFTLYSPELYAAQQEYLLALASENTASASLVRAAQRRLALWGLTDAQIAAIAKRGEPIENMPFLSPASGYVLEKNVVEGGAVKAGERLFRIVPLQTVWVEADVYEQDLPHVEVGKPVRVTLPYMPGRAYEGRVSYVYPTLDDKTRTGKVRIELPNDELVLKPDMYADVAFELKTDEVLQVPESAVIYTGPRTLVFVDLGEGRLRPQVVKLGRKGEEAFEVLEGLAPGDEVVTSGNFLIAAESRIRSAADYWSGGGDEAE